MTPPPPLPVIYWMWFHSTTAATAALMSLAPLLSTRPASAFTPGFPLPLLCECLFDYATDLDRLPPETFF